MMRGTGRTTRMLLRAILCFLEGNNVVVGAYNRKYTDTLCRQCKDILYALRFSDKIDLDMQCRIRYHDKIMWFTSSDELNDWDRYMRGDDRNWQRFNDHFYPLPEYRRPEIEVTTFKEMLNRRIS